MTVDLQKLLDSDFVRIIEAWDESPPPPKKRKVNPPSAVESHPGDAWMTAAEWTEATMSGWSSKKMDRYLAALRRKHDGVIPESQRSALMRVRRKLRNKESARLSRKRKAKQLQEYEETICCLRSEVERLRTVLRRKACPQCSLEPDLSCHEIFVL